MAMTFAVPGIAAASLLVSCFVAAADGELRGSLRRLAT
jgi:hypothetical protein